MLNVAVLAESNYSVVAIVDGDRCPAIDFLTQGEVSTEAVRAGLIEMIEKVAECGLQDVPSSWFHEVDKPNRIYEFIKGPLRLFFFKGQNGQIAVCTSGGRKTSGKVDRSVVAKAVRYRDQYLKAARLNQVKVVEYGSS